MIPPSPDYILARRVIDRLKTDADLTDMVYPDPWDDADATARIARAQAKYRGSIAVTPAGLINLWSSDPAQHVRQLQATLVISLLAAPGVTRSEIADAHPTAASWLSGIAYAVIDALVNWAPPGVLHPYAKPVIVAVEDYDLSKVEGLKNLIGKAIIITAPVTIRPRQ